MKRRAPDVSRRHSSRTSSLGTDLSRREWIVSAATGTALFLLARHATAAEVPAAAERVEVSVYRSPTCGCCGLWMEYMKKAGFEVVEHNVADVTPIKRAHRIPQELYSCHTAVADTYVFEGHVPADLVTQVLKERPALAGLAVPGMPQSAPGMDQGHERYEVFSFTRDGRTKVIAVRS